MLIYIIINCEASFLQRDIVEQPLLYKVLYVFSSWNICSKPLYMSAYHNSLRAICHVDMVEMEEITSVSFDDVSSITAAKGLWLFNQNVVLSDVDCKSGRCGFFNSTAESKLEIAYFSNAFDRFETFTARLFFKRSIGVSGLKALITNADCDDAGSVVASSGSNTLNGHLTNTTGASVGYHFPVRIPIDYCLKFGSDMCQ